MGAQRAFPHDPMNPLRSQVQAWLEGKSELAPITGLLGIRPLTLETGSAIVEMTVTKKLHNAMGFLHGGVFLDLADVAMGAAMATGLDENESFLTVQSSIHHTGSIATGRLRAQASIIHRGRNIAHLECLLSDVRGRILAKVISVCLIRPRGRRPA